MEEKIIEKRKWKNLFFEIENFISDLQHKKQKERTNEENKKAEKLVDNFNTLFLEYKNSNNNTKDIPDRFLNSLGKSKFKIGLRMTSFFEILALDIISEAAKEEKVYFFYLFFLHEDVENIL